jgi:transcriptional regulator with GAF, ATPase, and Fis domain
LEEIRKLKEQVEAENLYLRESITTKYAYGEIVGHSPAIQKVLGQVQKVAPTDSTVLIEGETGVGKELVARAIHSLSARKNRLMVTVNCATLPAALIESELFGRESGAYTGALSRQIGRFEVADGSTIFLDEIGELPIELQTRLLRVLQEGEFERLGSPKKIKVDVRVIASTNRDLAEEVHKGNFRKDLYYRLRVFPIQVPPLRERPEDIPLLVKVFVDEFGKKMGKTIQTVSRKTLETLQRYSWPGNIRELRNVVEHAMIISSGSKLNILLPEEPALSDSPLQTLEETERQYILEVLEKTNWRIKGRYGAAEILGLNPSTLYFKMKKLNISTREDNGA